MSRHARKSGTPPLALDPEWQRWLAENLLLGIPANTIAAELVTKGCPPDIARREIAEAEASPYFRAAEALRARLTKRDWHLRVAATHERMAPDMVVPRRHGLPAEIFLTEHYVPQRPVLLTGLVDHWPARDWTLERLAALPGNTEIEVQQGREADAEYEINSTAHKTLQPLSAVLARLRRDEPTNDFYVTANNSGHNRAALAPLWDEIGDIPGYLDRQPGRDGFLWIGPRGTVTPWHHDLTNNLLLQLVGTKRVHLVSSAQTPLMRNHRHCYSQFGGDTGFAGTAGSDRPQALEVEIGPGEILFIPVGWWHHVVGVTATIGFSFTNLAWPNAAYDGYTTYGPV